VLRCFLLLFVFTSPAVTPAAEPSVTVETITVNGTVRQPDASGQLHLPPGPHRLEFAVRVDEGESAIPLRVRATLAGHETDWREVSGQMALVAEFLNAAGEVTGGERFPCSGVTPGYHPDWKNTLLLQRREPLLVPAGSRSLRLTLSSGSPQTTGRLILDDLTVNLPGGGRSARDDLWKNSGFSTLRGYGPSATPDRWRRGGVQPSVAEMAGGPAGPALALNDDDPSASGEWIGEIELDDRVQPGMTLSLAWLTAWAVNPGTQHHIIYKEVPAGDYEFRVAGIAAAGGWTGASTALKIHIAPHLWERPWFWPAAAASLVALFGAAGLLLWHQRMQRKLDRLAAQHALERDRARIARDMHDDLGARLTRISLLTALTEREITSGDAATARTHIRQLSGLSREVTGAIDEIVWAVDSGNDTLDHLGTYLCRFADEFFADTAIRCRFGIPPVLPPVPLGAEVRHNLFLAVKEALNNVAKHASPCEARLEMEIAAGHLRITVSDNGPGFTPDPGLSGNGLRNMERRLADIGGTCTTTSSSAGTTVTLHWPIPAPL
jgi:signal transduction histidine kinase